MCDWGSFRDWLVELPALVKLFCGGFGVFLAVESLQTQFMPLLFGCLTFLFLVFLCRQEVDAVSQQADANRRTFGVHGGVARVGIDRGE